MRIMIRVYQLMCHFVVCIFLSSVGTRQFRHCSWLCICLIKLPMDFTLMSMKRTNRENIWFKFILASKYVFFSLVLHKTNQVNIENRKLSRISTSQFTFKPKDSGSIPSVVQRYYLFGDVYIVSDIITYWV